VIRDWNRVEQNPRVGNEDSGKFSGTNVSKESWAFQPTLMTGRITRVACVEPRRSANQRRERGSGILPRPSISLELSKRVKRHVTGNKDVTRRAGKVLGGVRKSLQHTCLSQEGGQSNGCDKNRQVDRFKRSRDRFPGLNVRTRAESRDGCCRCFDR